MTSTASRQIANIAAYRFVTLTDRETLREQLLGCAQALKLNGTILLAPEGINIFLAGSEESIRIFLTELQKDVRFADLQVKWSWSKHSPFTRLRIKLKKEIITARSPQVDPQRDKAPYLPATQLKQWLDEGRDIVLLDTRNEFEVTMGTFTNAIDPHIQSFGEFPKRIKELTELQDKTVVTFCTGGIRCEKAAPLLQQAGFKDVWQLEGGILQYFETCGGEHWQGMCTVFDGRIAVTPDLEPLMDQAPSTQPC